MQCLRMQDQELAGKRVLIREDLNVPIQDGKVTSEARLQASLPTIRLALDAGARVMLLSHLGRPTEGTMHGKYGDYSLKPVADRLTDLLGKTVRLQDPWLDGVEPRPGEVVLCENVRLQPGEMDNDEDLARRMAGLCDIFVMDAFGTAHRAQASTHGVARYAPIACAGPLLCSELDALEHAMQSPQHPLSVILGGSKVSTKLELLENLTEVADHIILGGGIANTFLAAHGHPVGRSLHEPGLVDEARRFDEKMRRRGGHMVLPTDVVVADEVSDGAKTMIRSVSEVADPDMILDVGPDSRQQVADALADAGTILWNGPLGVFEHAPFAEGTRVLSQAVARSSAYSVAGGGDTLAAIERFGVGPDISYISTGGGAFLEFLEGKTLPAVAMLEQRATQNAAEAG